MAIDKGNIKTSANYDVRAQKPLDGRAVRPAKGDLIKKESWSSDGNTVYVYEGMQVYVEDEKKTYYLKDLSKMFASDFSGWELMGTGAAAEVEVDTELSETSENAIANSTVSKALAGKQNLLMDGINIKTINGQNVLGRGNITIEGGGGGITEEKEVYIGEEEPTDDGAKLWIDPTGTPNQPSAGVEVIDNLESDSTTAALSANQGRVLKEMIERGGASGGAESPYAMKVFIVPEGVMAATEDAPYTFNAEETEEFLAQGDFKRTIVKYPVQSILGVPQQVIANVSFYVEMDSSNGVLVCGGTEFSYLSTEADGVTKLVSVDHYQTNIQCLNNQGTIMGFGTRNTHTIKNN